MAYISNQKEDDLLYARANDLIEQSGKSGNPRFMGFLNERQQHLLELFLKKRCEHSFFGGSEQSERRLLAVGKANDENFPVSSVTIKYRVDEAVTLRHGDFLGSLMALGIKRELVGDIFCEAGVCVVFCHRDILLFILQNLTKVSKFSVSVEEGITVPLPSSQEYQEIIKSIASERLDCVIGALLNLGREQSSEVILTGLVTVNHLAIQKSTTKIMTGDSIAVRGHGKYKIENIDEATKKGRVRLKALKYV